MDLYQSRYLKHQKNKKRILSKIVQGSKKELNLVSDFEELCRKRRSVRLFDKKEVDEKMLDQIIDSARFTPSSCNRQAIKLKIVYKKDNQELEKLLVGGKIWLKKAPVVILLFADRLAYKSPNEKVFMPYLDAGCMLMNLCYLATSHGFGACIVNPNIREENREKFNQLFNKKKLQFCGGVALGYAAHSPKMPKRQEIDEFLL